VQVPEDGVGAGVAGVGEGVAGVGEGVAGVGARVAGVGAGVAGVGAGVAGVGAGDGDEPIPKGAPDLSAFKAYTGLLQGSFTHLWSLSVLKNLHFCCPG